MRETIHKFRLKDWPTRRFTQYLPYNAKVVHFGFQDGDPHIWVRLDPEQDQKEERTFIIAGTEHEIDSNMKHISSILNGPLVWHLLEELK